MEYDWKKQFLTDPTLAPSNVLESAEQKIKV